MATSTPTPATPAPTPAAPVKTKAAGVGQIVYFYPDRDRAKGMKSVDDTEPMAAIVAAAPTDRLINVLAIDHAGTTFAFQGVPLWQGDDKDDHTAPFHCEFEPPPPRKVVTASGVQGEPIPLALGTNIAAAGTVADAKLTFTVPVGDTYTFISQKAGISQSFIAGPKPQSLTLTTAQIAAGALTDLTVTASSTAPVALTIGAVDQNSDGTIGQTYRLTEDITVAAPPPVPAPSPVVTPPATPPATGVVPPPPPVAPAVAAPGP